MIASSIHRLLRALRVGPLACTDKCFEILTEMAENAAYSEICPTFEVWSIDIDSVEFVLPSLASYLLVLQIYRKLSFYSMSNIPNPQHLWIKLDEF